MAGRNESMRHAYISYAREDSAFANLIETELLSNDYDVWRATTSVEDEDWAKAIKQALEDAYALVVVLSCSGSTSEWVLDEVAGAVGRIPVFALRIEACDPPPVFDQVTVVDFEKVWAAEGIEQLRLYGPALRELIEYLDNAQPVRMAIRELTSSTDDVIRELAAKRLGELGDLSATDALIDGVSDVDVDVRYTAAEALGLLGAEAAVKPLSRALTDPDADVRAAAAEALGRLGDAAESSKEKLRELLEDPDRFVRTRAVEALGQMAATESVAEIIHVMRNDAISDARHAAAESLRAIGTPNAIKALSRLGFETTPP